MSDYAFINDLSKEKVYYVYVNVCHENKAYERVTRKQMIKAIYDVYLREPDTFLNMLLWDEWLDVKNIITTKPSKHQVMTFGHPSYKFFITIGLYAQTVHPDLVSHVMSLTYDQKKTETDHLIRLLIGISRIHGFLRMDKAYQILTRFIPDISYDDFLLLPVRYKRVLTDFNIYSLEGEMIMLHENCDIPLEFIDDEHLTYDYTLNDYLSVADHWINRQDLNANALFQMVQKKTEPWQSDMLMKMIWTSATQSKRSLIPLMFPDLFGDSDEGRAMHDLLSKVTKTMPDWFMAGQPKHLVERIAMSHEPKVTHKYDPCPCGSGVKYKFCCKNTNLLFANRAILNPEDHALFYYVINELVKYANDRLYKEAYNEAGTAFFGNLDQEQFTDLMDFVFDHIDIIDAYMDDHANHLYPDVANVLKGFKRAVTGEFAAIGFRDQKLLMLSEDDTTIYLVSGISQPLSDFFNNDDLPSLVRTTLIPFGGHIVYAVSLRTISIVLGRNYRVRIASKVKKAITVETF